VTRPSDPPSVVAGVDLGSNSFHMIVARINAGQLSVIDRLKERVRLAEGLDAKRNLTPEAFSRALACLERFGQRIRELPPGSVRVAGTNALRMARNSAEFIERGAQVLGHPIEIVAGREEARLIYLGVSHSVPSTDGRRLVVDIGGGSTECILGEGFDSIETESLFMGCVNYTARYFPNDSLKRDGFRRAETAAMVEFQSLESTYRALGWRACYGSSGTVISISQLLGATFGEHTITLKGLKKLRAALCDAGSINKLQLPGLDPERAPVLAGGLAILLGTFKSLRIDSMQPASGALREGLLYDLLGRVGDEDVRERSIRGLADRAQVDSAQAARVESTALGCLRQIAESIGDKRKEYQRYLTWASRLHEIGLQISHPGYHKHGAYIVENSDMAGFSRNEQQLLALVIRTHRRKFHLEFFDALPGGRREMAIRTALLFRLAYCLNRSRSNEPVPPFELNMTGLRMVLTFKNNALEQAPLTRADLEEERQHLKAVGLELDVRGA
jgi:exopolyphosphatase / guanosine-5'-triphosphate,3'-diphosphate pyrophosphatase